MPDGERAGGDPRFDFMSALCALALCLFVSLWWGRPFVVCGVALAVFFCGRGLWRLHVNRRQKNL